jgi:hypothetical protein
MKKFSNPLSIDLGKFSVIKIPQDLLMLRSNMVKYDSVFGKYLAVNKPVRPTVSADESTQCVLLEEHVKGSAQRRRIE